MPTQSATASSTVSSRYAEQAASDLEQNCRQQQELTEQLENLRREEGLLRSILDLTGTPHFSPTAANNSAERKPVASAKRMPSAQQKKTTRRTAPRRLLSDLLLELLSEHKEPSSAKELREELLQAHPGQMPTPQVVRNTLESLVAKGRIVRDKHNRSVRYIVVGQTDATTTLVTG